MFSCNNEKTDGDIFYTFQDASGRIVSLDKKPQKVAILFSSFADIWTLSGGDIAITVGESVERGFADEGVILVDSGAGHTSINTELLLSERPDLVIGTADYAIQRECVDFLSSVGINAASLRVESLEDYLSVLKIFTDINGTPEIYAEHGEKIEEKTASLLSSVLKYTEGNEKPKILFIRSGSSEKSAKAKSSDDNFACMMLKELDTINIADSAPLLLDGLSLESIMTLDPDFIFISPMGDKEASMKYISSLFKKDGWSSLSAVKNGNVIFLEKELFHYKPNALWFDSYLFLAKTLYPELEITEN